MSEATNDSRVAPWATAPKTGKTQLYRHYDADDNLLYVGISLSTMMRLAQHRADSAWSEQVVRVMISHYPTRAEALRAEAEAIRLERPLFNVAGKGASVRSFPQVTIKETKFIGLRAAFAELGIKPKGKKP